MKDSKGYLARMEKAMKEKLFFTNHIDLDNKIIIDFGAADGSLVRELINRCYENTTYICIENNEEFFEQCKKLKSDGDVYVFSGLSEVEMWLREHKRYMQDHREVVLVCSSVMHELTIKMQRAVVGFSRAYCDYFVVRDMFYDEHSIEDERLLEMIENIIILNQNIDLMQQYFYLRGLTKESIAEYLLKYSYVENWNTEVHEKYLSVDWISIRYFTTEEADAKILYENIYTNKFIASRVYNTFGIVMDWPTHCQLVLRINRIEVKDYE